MSDPSTTPKDVEVPKVVPLKETFWQKFKRSQAASGRRMRKIKEKQRGIRDPARSLRK